VVERGRQLHTDISARELSHAGPDHTERRGQRRPQKSSNVHHGPEQPLGAPHRTAQHRTANMPLPPPIYPDRYPQYGCFAVVLFIFFSHRLTLFLSSLLLSVRAIRCGLPLFRYWYPGQWARRRTGETARVCSAGGLSLPIVAAVAPSASPIC
jgi:hypothetical protein